METTLQSKIDYLLNTSPGRGATKARPALVPEPRVTSASLSERIANAETDDEALILAARHTTESCTLAAFEMLLARPVGKFDKPATLVQLAELLPNLPNSDGSPVITPLLHQQAQVQELSDRLDGFTVPEVAEVLRLGADRNGATGVLIAAIWSRHDLGELIAALGIGPISSKLAASVFLTGGPCDVAVSANTYETAFAYLNELSTGPLRDLLAWHPDIRDLFGGSAGGRAPWSDYVRAQTIPQALLTRLGLRGPAWVAAWALAGGANSELRARIAAMHSPSLLITAGGMHGCPEDLDHVVEFLTDCGDELDVATGLSMWFTSVTTSPPTRATQPNTLARTLVNSDVARNTDFLGFLTGQIPNWYPDPNVVVEVARSLPDSAFALGQKLAWITDSTVVTEQLIAVVLHAKGLFRHLPGPSGQGNELGLKIMDDYLTTHPVEPDLFAAAARSWTGSFADLVDTLRVVDS